MANKNLTLGQLRKFFDGSKEREYFFFFFFLSHIIYSLTLLSDMFETEDGYISGENDSFHLPVERLGRLGHCVTAWDETYAICDASIPKNEIQKIEKAPKLSNQPIVSFLSERGAFAIADTEYKYACTGGKEVILSTGYEFPLEEYENVLKSLEDVWVPPLVKPAKKR